MSDKATFIAGAVVIGAACLAGVTLLPRINPLRASPEAQEMKPAPAFSLPVISKGEKGSRLALEDLKGSVVLVDFWATWCGACSMQTPIVDRIAKRYQERGLHVVSVNVFDDDHSAAAQEAQRWSFPVVVDETGLTQKAYGVDRLPTLILIDKEGRIVKTTHGLIDENSLDRMVREAM
ncbi:MAG: TlpA family protein disulfide reductase [Polyangiaceae bacterium]|nr:TlpA family protein disulfide reductase [Polyangiaceae bacterium]